MPSSPASPSSHHKTVIVAAQRTPIGKFLGGLAGFSAPQLGALAIRAVLAKAGLEPSLIEETLMGQVVQAGAGQNPARQASLGAGLSHESLATTVNVVCGSGLKALILADQAIRSGENQIMVAGGMESMSNAPFLLPAMRGGQRFGHSQVLDANVQDGLWCAWEHWRMGDAAEMLAQSQEIARADQDQFALASQQRAIAATEQGLFAAEIAPVTIAGKKASTVINHDEAPRADTTLAGLAQLRPAFGEGGSVTAGNAPGLSDGAAALLVMREDVAAAHGLTPLAEVLGAASHGLAPKWFTLAPVGAIEKLLAKLGLQTGDIDLYELNEAFAVQSLGVMRALGLDSHNVNVHGGAVALGHPIGCSGARIVVTLLHALRQQQKEIGIASLCMGGANGLALAIRAL
jgi:acetyl-CoA C-acetyltransferase